MYKKSKFNIYSLDGEKLIIYNTLSGGLISLKENYLEDFNDFDYNGKCQNKELEDNLKKGKMIVEEDMDENKYIDIMHNIQKYNNYHVSLTIAPTLECNFACTYCYEAGRRYTSMNHEIEDKIIEYLDANLEKENKTLHITWYGGEPLLKTDTIYRISKHIASKGYTYTSGIVTNGYLLDYEIGKKLKECSISHIQVTIDGPPEIHDKRRMLLNGGPTFEKIMENVSEICNETNISIRVNIDRDNLKKVAEMLDIFDTYNLKGKVGVYLAPVDNINGTCSQSNCLSSKEFADVNAEFYEKYNYRGYSNINLPTSNLYICGAINPYSLIISPNGDLYKCWDDIGNNSEKVGNISEGISLTPKNVSWISYDYMIDSECNSCEILPICMGGCPNFNMKGGQKKCHPLKYNHEKIIKMIITLYNQKQNNNNGQ